MQKAEKMTIRRFDKTRDSLEKLAQLFQSGLGETEIEFWRWKYFRLNGFDHQRMYIIEEKDQIVAMMGFIPVEYTYQDKRYKAAQMCDLVVHPDFRGRGYFYTICDYAYKEFKQDGYDVFIGFPNENSRHGLEKMNYNFTRLKTYDSMFNFLHIIMKMLKIKHRYYLNTKFTSRVSEGFCDFYFNEKQTMTSDCVRLDINKKYLCWKCGDYMDGKYIHIDVFDGEIIVAYFIVRITKGRRITAAKVVNFDISQRYIGEIFEIAKAVKNEIYSVADIFEFCGIWSKTVNDLMRKAFSLNKGKAATIVAYKMLSNKELTDNVFINHLDTDL